MKESLLILFLILHLTNAEAQYPAPLPSSGPISIQSVYNWMQAAGEISTGPYSLSDLNSHSHLADKTAPYSLSDWYGYQWVCGNVMQKTHTAGTVAAVTKTINYKTTSSSLSGTSKCWITQNLGADRQATLLTDNTEASAGWYWQFNRSQGYNVADDNTTRTPATTWISSIDETSDWLASRDPCTLLLGSGWRLPTYLEWNNVLQNSGWNVTYTAGAYASELKIHPAGYISPSGTLYARGVNIDYWSSTQLNTTLGHWLFATITVNYSDGYVGAYNKAHAFSVRCLKD